MEAAARIPRVGIRRQDLPELAALLDVEGPFASVQLPTWRASADAETRFGRQWRDLARDLEAAGADGALVDRLGDALRLRRTDDDALVGVIAPTSGPLVGLSRSAEAHATWDRLPELLPWITRAQCDQPALLVLVDRTGADVFTTGSGTLPTAVVDGEDGPVVHRSAPGGWSQRRFQARAEESWKSNAREVAAAVTGEALRIGARLIVVAGDDHAVGSMVAALPQRLAPLVRTAPGARGVGAEGGVEAEAARLHRTIAAEEDVELIRVFKEELGRRRLAVAGTSATAAALRSAAVDTLLLAADTAGSRLFFRAGTPTMVAEREADLEGLDLRDGPCGDVMVRAAWHSGSAVRVVPRLPELTDGVGAVLRRRSTG